MAVLLFGVLASGLAWRQLVMHQEYREREERQSQRRIIQPGPRGNIYDYSGKILVGNRPRFSAVVYLEELRSEFHKEYVRIKRELEDAHDASGSEEKFTFDWEEILWQARENVLQKYLDEINDIIGTNNQLSRRDIRRHFGERLLMPFELFSDLTEEQYARLIEQLPLGSVIGIYTDTTRYYPHGPAAAHVLGYVRGSWQIPPADLPGENLRTYSYKSEVGINGLEKEFNEVLQGESGGEVHRVDNFQYQFGDPIAQKNAKQGESIQTTLDIDLQLAAEKALGDRTGAVAAIMVETGEVLVLASSPGYDLNDFSPRLTQETVDEINEKGAWVSRATKGLYPPGSTFKLLTSVAGMRAGTLDPDEQVKGGSYFRVGNRLFPEHNGGPYYNIDLPMAIEKSSNVYYYDQGIRAGIDNISAEARRFGFDTPLGLELPFPQTRMLIPDKEWSRRVRGYGWRPGDTANVAIGQGDLLVTPLHVAAFTASLARRETRTDLTLIKRQPGEVIDHGGEPIGISDYEYNKILEGMERVVGPRGTGRYAMIDGIRIAGKTGTAQVKRPSGKITLAWFAGFAPIENPQIAIAVIVEGTSSTDHYAGGSTAAPVARAVMKEFFKERAADELLSMQP
ncbi:penicillin-binding transpeptidase domain-containing protein [Cerasicoccus maritimus]|uniref:penicillin-binding transpeptidase domain-containing protein n=1 Tax=Cerasicoccus maritimus TaxID=490089 RepID=UPI002852BF47|nr:penicillin-binding transpeptidase domain-containing protein [Cerasicoccus maritimus]